MCLMVWHPKNPEQAGINKGNVAPPSVFQFHGGAEVNNNANNIITIHKESKVDYSDPYQVYFNKIKPKQCGEIGMIELYYNWKKQRFYDFDALGTQERAYAKQVTGTEEKPYD